MFKKMFKIRSLVLISLCYIFLLSFTCPGHLHALEGKTLAQRIKSVTLENGLQILMLPRHVSPTVSFYIRYRSGAVDERDGKTGLAHLLEHMMFKGTKTIGTKDFKPEMSVHRRIALTGEALDLEKDKGLTANKNKIETLKKTLKVLQEKEKTLIISNEIDRLYSENGAVGLNASTGQDLTTYHVSLPANKIELWARIESDRMANPVFREFFQERDVVLEERRQRIESNPDGKLYEAYLNAAFSAHPYRRPVIGWESDIKRLGMADLDAFSRLHHAPNNTVIAVVGDIDTKHVQKIIKKYFGAIPRQSIIRESTTQEPRQSGERRVSVHLDANPQLIIGYHKPPPPAHDDYVFEVIESILSRGRTSRFYKTLVEEKGLAEDVQASNGTPGSRYPNQFVILATPRHPHGNKELESAILEMIEKLKKDPVTASELQKIKNQVRSDYIRRQSSNDGLAGMLSYYQALLGDFRYITTYADAIDKITIDDVLLVAKTYLVKENRTIANIVKD